MGIICKLKPTWDFKLLAIEINSWWFWWLLSPAKDWTRSENVLNVVETRTSAITVGFQAQHLSEICDIFILLTLQHDPLRAGKGLSNDFEILNHKFIRILQLRSCIFGWFSLKIHLIFPHWGFTLLHFGCSFADLKLDKFSLISHQTVGIRFWVLFSVCKYKKK